MVYNDGHGCAPPGNGPAKIVDENTLQFTFADTAGKAGTGTIKRVGDGVIISIKPTRAADPRCIVFYKGDIRLKRAHYTNVGGACVPRSATLRTRDQIPRARDR